MTAELPNGGITQAQKVNFHNILEADNIRVRPSGEFTSDVFSTHFVDAAVGCITQKNPTKCQVLANLCVLQMYDSSSAACIIFNWLKDKNTSQVTKKGADPDWKRGLPWLTYSNSASTLLKTSLSNHNFDLTVGFYNDKNAKRSDSLRFKLGVYNINGTFVGFQDLDNQMSPCPMTYNDVINMKKFGTMTENSCEFNLDNLINPPAYLPTSESMIYELFLEDDKGMMIDVPVLIRNLKLKDGSQPNVGEVPLDTWVFKRRFTIFDSHTGITQPNGYLSGAKPKYLRYAHETKIKVTLDPTQLERIYRPYVIISY